MFELVIDEIVRGERESLGKNVKLDFAAVINFRSMKRKPQLPAGWDDGAGIRCEVPCNATVEALHN
jgi:hypothetical protein